MSVRSGLVQHCLERLVTDVPLHVLLYVLLIACLLTLKADVHHTKFFP